VTVEPKSELIPEQTPKKFKKFMKVNKKRKHLAVNFITPLKKDKKQ